MRSLKWLFGLVVVTLVWNSDLTNWLKEFAVFLGAAPQSVLWHLVVDGGAPLALTIIAGVSLWFYESLLFPLLPLASSLGGWWIYTLQGRNPAKPLIVGYFLVKHSSERIEITEGCAFYVKQAELRKRGDWRSNGITFDNGNFNVLFTIEAATSCAEALPTHAKGLFILKKTRVEPVGGVRSWSGMFQDLYDRRDVFGPMYAEQLSRFRLWNATKIELLLNEWCQDLTSRLPE